MEIINFNKLVRDKIPKQIKKNGGKCKVKILSVEGLKDSLPQKLEEEVGELINATTPKDKLSECADVVEVLLTASALNYFSLFSLREEREEFRRNTNLVPEILIPTLTQLVKDYHEDRSRESVRKISAIGIEVILEIVKIESFTREELERQISDKKKSRGGFRKGYFLVWATKK